MNINVRLRRFHQRQGVTVPAWADLQKLNEAEVKALAERLNLAFTDRMDTLSRIHKTRG